MLTLFYAPGACSLAPHILLHEAGVDHEARTVDVRAKTLEDGSDFIAINPKGAVPAIDLGDDRGVLTENAVLLQYIADQNGREDLLPALGTIARYRTLETVNFIATEVHKGFGPMWNPATGEETKSQTRDLLAKKLAVLDRQLEGRDYLMGDSLTIADPYLFVMFGWSRMHGVPLDSLGNLAAFRERMVERPAVRQTLEKEGLLERAEA